MKKSILWMLLGVLLIGCGANNEHHYTNNDVSNSFPDTLHNTDIPADVINSLSTVYEILEIETNLYKQYQSEISINNPFTEPLIEFFSDSYILPDYYEMDNNMAFLVDLDGNGTLGVVAVKYERIGYSIHTRSRIFYLSNEEILYKDIPPNFNYISPNINWNGSIIFNRNRRLMLGDAMNGTLFYTLFKLENDILIYSFTVFTEIPFADGEFLERHHGTMLNSNFAGIDFDSENFKFITEECFDKIKEKYVLEFFGDIRYSHTIPYEIKLIFNMTLKELNSTLE